MDKDFAFITYSVKAPQCGERMFSIKIHLGVELVQSGVKGGKLQDRLALALQQYKGVILLVQDGCCSPLCCSVLCPLLLELSCSTALCTGKEAFSGHAPLGTRERERERERERDETEGRRKGDRETKREGGWPGERGGERERDEERREAGTQGEGGRESGRDGLTHNETCTLQRMFCHMDMRCSLAFSEAR